MQKLYVAVKKTGVNFYTIFVERSSHCNSWKMNVFTKHIFFQTENAFSIDTHCMQIQQTIHLVRNVCVHKDISLTTGWTIVSDSNNE